MQKYYRFYRGRFQVHIPNRKDLRKTYFPCGRWKFTHRLTEVDRPDTIDDVCKKCSELYDVYEHERQAFNDDVMSDFLKE